MQGVMRAAGRAATSASHSRLIQGTTAAANQQHHHWPQPPTRPLTTRPPNKLSTAPAALGGAGAGTSTPDPTTLLDPGEEALRRVSEQQVCAVCVGAGGWD